jgi:hypothetical protein
VNQPDLALIVESWERLPSGIKAGILAMVKAVVKCESEDNQGVKK